MQPKEYLDKIARESIQAREDFYSRHAEDLIRAACLMGEAVGRGNKIMFMGNGGSAGDSQHAAAELTGRLLVKRRPLPGLALTTDTSCLTAVGNDYSFDDVFSRQIEALAKKGDIVIAISTSGSSPNILKGITEAKKHGCLVFGLTGGTGGKLKDVVDICFNVAKGENSGRIQETHIFALHALVDLMDQYYLPVLLPEKYRT